MAHPAAQLIEGETENDRLRMVLADAQADLQRHSATLSRLQGELMASRLEVSGAREETIQFRGFLRHSEAQAAAAHAHIEDLRAHAAKLHADVATLHVGLADLRAEINAIRTSFSWRITRPARVTSRLIRRCYRKAITLGIGFVVAQPRLHRGIKRVYRSVPGLQGHLHRFVPAQNLPPLVLPPAPPPATGPADPNEPYIFKPAPFSSDTQGAVTLDQLYHLSRSL